MLSQRTTRYGGSVPAIVERFTLHLRHTFGDDLRYVGTTTHLDVDPRRIRDIDVLVVLSSLSDSHMSYVLRIISRLHERYNLAIDARVYSEAQLEDQVAIPTINRYLLSIALQDQHGENPFRNAEVDATELRAACMQRLKDQEQRILKQMPRVVGEPTQVRTLAQGVYDAVRAFLILENRPVASKEAACACMEREFRAFPEAASIYDGYLDPSSVVDTAAFVLDSLALVKHLGYRAEAKQVEDLVLLVNTPSSQMPHPRDDYLRYDHNMPLGLLCLASHLHREEVPVQILDAYAENLGVISTVDDICRRAKLPRIIGLNASSPNIGIAQDIARYLKRVCGEIVIVCGGPHASLATEHTLSTGAIDYAIVGEGEVPLAKLAKNVLKDATRNVPAIGGVYYRAPDALAGRTNSELLDLGTIAAPEFGMLPLERYFAIRRRVYIHTSRGCGFNCTYCSVPTVWSHAVREIPTAVILDQLQTVISQYEPEQLQIVDDNFSHHGGEMIRAFCRGLIERSINIGWKCQVRADQLDEALIEEMLVSGCFEIDMGIESGDKATQKAIRKKLDLEKTACTVEAIAAKASGLGKPIVSKAFFMLGFPQESWEQLANTINYAVRLKECGLSDIAFFPVMPFPGTELAKQHTEVHAGAVMDEIDVYERSFAAHRLRKYAAKPEVSLNDLLTPEELRLLVKFAYQRFDQASQVTSLENEFREYCSVEDQFAYGL